MVLNPTIGAGLEARVQRFFMAQGVFAERGLFPSASPDHSMIATDIDVLVSEYVGGFHLTRRHAECKGGRIPLVDRILWLKGVRELLGADGSYLVVSDFNKDASDFALSLGIQLINFKQLEEWESAIPVQNNLWPCRSDYETYDNAQATWATLSGAIDSDADWKFLRDVTSFIRIDSWLTFRYRHLNKLFRLLDDMGKQYERIRSDSDRALCSRYCFSALLVRLSQYLLAICYDVTRLPTTDIGVYLQQHLIYGDQDPVRASGLIDHTINWVKQGLEKKGIQIPPEINAARLYQPPSYAPDLLELVNRILQQSNEARYLPIAMETEQFGTPTVINKFSRLKVAATIGDGLAALIKGFVIRAFSTPKGITEPVSEDLRVIYQIPTEHPTRHVKKNKTQLPLTTQPQTLIVSEHNQSTA